MKKELDVVAALIRNGNATLLCQRYEHDRYGLLWEFPGGGKEEGESHADAIEREIQEELGLTVKAEKVLEHFSDEDESLIIRVSLFLCTIQAGIPTAKECNRFGFFTVAQIEELPLAPVDKKIFAFVRQR